MHALKACMVKVPKNSPRCGVCTQKLVMKGRTSSVETRAGKMWVATAVGLVVLE